MWRVQIVVCSSAATSIASCRPNSRAPLHSSEISLAACRRDAFASTDAVQLSPFPVVRVLVLVPRCVFEKTTNQLSIVPATKEGLEPVTRTDDPRANYKLPTKTLGETEKMATSRQSLEDADFARMPQSKPTTTGTLRATQKPQQAERLLC